MEKKNISVGHGGSGFKVRDFKKKMKGKKVMKKYSSIPKILKRVNYKYGSKLNYTLPNSMEEPNCLSSLTLSLKTKWNQ